jgi:hypothetical protein
MLLDLVQHPDGCRSRADEAELRDERMILIETDCDCAYYTEAFEMCELIMEILVRMDEEFHYMTIRGRAEF